MSAPRGPRIVPASPAARCRKAASKLELTLMAMAALALALGAPSPRPARAQPAARSTSDAPPERAASPYAVIEKQSVVVSFVHGAAELEETSHAALGALLASLDPATRRGPVTIVAWPDATSPAKDLVARRLGVLDALLSAGGAVGPVTRHDLGDVDDPLARAVDGAAGPTRAPSRGAPSELARFLAERGGPGKGAVLVGDAGRP